MTQIEKTQKTENPRKTTASKPVSEENNRDKEFEDMKRKLEMLSKALEKQNKINNSIDLDDDVDVISTCNGTLNLATGGFGKGEIYKFTEFGQIIPIPFRDLKEIVKNNRSFLAKGFFYIDNSDAMVALRVAKLCEKLPTVEELTDILKKDVQVAKKILKMCTKEQKEMVASFVVEKLMHNENSVDMNLVKVIGDSVNEDLLSVSKIKKELVSGGGD